MVNRLLRTLVLLTLAAMGSASAGTFSVSPVRIFMAPKDRAVAVTVSNDGDEDLVMQAEVFEWRQKPGGDDELVATDDVVLNPPILKMSAHSRQVVRLALLQPPPAGGDQLTYRLLLREVPEARPTDKPVQLQIALAFSLPVFITPPNSKRQLSCQAESAVPAVRVRCENKGTAYAQLKDFVLTSPAGERLAARETGGYLLPGSQRTFDLKSAGVTTLTGKARLEVLLDDGSTERFDVNLSP